MNQATFRENRTVAFFHTILHMTAMSFAKTITPGGAKKAHSAYHSIRPHKGGV
jgi:hypothetical protein